jgi:acyl-CoA synthetase (AMP-forming)/AMP-acid ligase II
MAHHLAGGTHAVLPSFNAEAVLDSIEGDRVTDMLLVPTMIQKLVDHPSAKANRDLGSLRRIVYGASAISEAVLERAMVTLPRVEFIHAYGMTEAAPIITFNPSGSHGPKNRALDKRLSCGRATYATEVRIADADGAEVPRGIVGEIWVRGPNVMQGYWNKPEETAAALRGGWLHTGDGGYMDEDGYIFIVDRLKDMIISGGENIYSVEVENVLARHPAVAICAVIGIPCEEWGEAVHAVVVTKTGEQVSCEALQAHCRALMARYKCPRSIEFRDSLPLSGAGKILKTTLRERFWQERERQVS